MTTSVDQAGLERRFTEMLAAARRRVHRSVLRALMLVAIDRALLSVVCVACTYCLLRFVCLVIGSAAPFGWAVYGWLVGAALIVPVTVTLIGALKSVPTLIEAAERLDLGTADHNRVATALCLVARGDRTAFSCAAIQDGLTYLHRLKDERPQLHPASPRWARGLRLAAVFVVATLAASVCGEAAIVPAADGQTPAVALPSIDRNPTGALDEEEHKPDRPSVERSPRSASSGGRRSHGAVDPGRPSSRSRGEAAGRRAGGGTSARANPSDGSANTRGESTDAAATSESRSSKGQKASSRKQPKTSRLIASREPEMQQDSSSVSQGGSGGGAMSAVRHSWSQQARTVEGEHEEEEDSDEEAEDESESSRQRGGVQPSLKDRNESPSRELGITGEEGPPGTGRGGPTPPKKSRGTASLVLGIPMPDFVKGRVGPGTTKVTHERVEPSPMPGDPTASVEVQPRSLPEAPSRRFEVPAAFAAAVRDYLVALHSADQMTDDRRRQSSSLPVEPPDE